MFLYEWNAGSYRNSEIPRRPDSLTLTVNSSSWAISGWVCSRADRKVAIIKLTWSVVPMRKLEMALSDCYYVVTSYEYTTKTRISIPSQNLLLHNKSCQARTRNTKVFLMLCRVSCTRVFAVDWFFCFGSSNIASYNKL